MRRALSVILGSQQFGLVAVILLLGTILTLFGGSHEDRATGQMVNNFLNPQTLMQVATFASFFAIMAVGMTMVIITTGIDLSVGSTYALSGVLTAMALSKMYPIVTQPAPGAVWVAMGLCLGIGLAAGLLNGFLITALGVHPFIITLGTMWIFRGVAFVLSNALSILVPTSLTQFAKAPLGFAQGVTPVPVIAMLIVAVAGWLFLTRTVTGRRIFAVGGNLTASQYSGVPIKRILVIVYAVSGLTAGIAAFLAMSYFGSAQSADAQGYELYVIASAVVGGASLAGGKGSAISAMLGALLISLIQQAIRTLKINQEYEWIIIGCAIIIAVVLDRVSARVGSARLTQGRL
ncbi:MAG: ABC transporter permease [Fimbriimonadaceae bacterium]